MRSGRRLRGCIARRTAASGAAYEGCTCVPSTGRDGRYEIPTVSTRELCMLLMLLTVLTHYLAGLDSRADACIYDARASQHTLKMSIY